MCMQFPSDQSYKQAYKLNLCYPNNSHALSCTGKLQPGKDVCVFISHSGSTKETVSAASQVLGKGVTTLGISKHQGMKSL